MHMSVYIYIYMSPLALQVPHGTSPEPGVYQASSGPCDHVPFLGQHTTWRKPVTVFSLGGAPTGGRCPVFSTTALQDVGLRQQRHPSQHFSGTTPRGRKPSSFYFCCLVVAAFLGRGARCVRFAFAF